MFLVIPASAATTLCSVYTGDFLIILLASMYIHSVHSGSVTACMYYKLCSMLCIYMSVEWLRMRVEWY